VRVTLPTRPRRQAWSLVALAALAASAAACGAGLRSGSSCACRGDEVCDSEGICRVLCDVTTDCADCGVCVEGLCHDRLGGCGAVQPQSQPDPQPAPSCDATTCASGCCRDGACLVQAALACGAQGTSCVDCTTDARVDSCSLSGVCVCAATSSVCAAGTQCAASGCVLSACALPWGGSLPEGGSVDAHQASQVACGQSCATQVRTCTQGVLSGSFTERTCVAQSCGYTWSTGAWGACSSSCGEGTQSRSVRCKSPDGRNVADNNCTTQKPASRQACSSCDCESGSASCTEVDHPEGSGLSWYCDVWSFAGTAGSGAICSNSDTVQDRVYSTRTSQLIGFSCFHACVP
jgi:Thrombospondin type 1 domain